MRNIKYILSMIISGFGEKRIDEENYKDMQLRSPNQTNERLNQLMLEYPEMFKCLLAMFVVFISVYIWFISLLVGEGSYNF